MLCLLSLIKINALLLCQRFGEVNKRIKPWATVLKNDICVWCASEAVVGKVARAPGMDDVKQIQSTELRP